MDARPTTRITAPHDESPSSGTRPRVPYTGVHSVVRRFLEPAQDTLVVLLALVLLGVMIRILMMLGADLISPQLSFSVVVAGVLFLLVLVELQRLLLIYLREHHVSVDVMIEATIVGVLREVLLLNPIEMDPLRLLALTAFVLTLGVLLRFGDIRAPQRRIRYHGATPDARSRGTRRSSSPSD